MKKNAKNAILKAMAKVSAKAAVVGANSVSMLGYHQPTKEV